jgi:hypothetical protein
MGAKYARHSIDDTAAMASNQPLVLRHRMGHSKMILQLYTTGMIHYSTAVAGTVDMAFDEALEQECNLVSKNQEHKKLQQKLLQRNLPLKKCRYPT